MRKHRAESMNNPAMWTNPKDTLPDETAWPIIHRCGPKSCKPAPFVT